MSEEVQTHVSSEDGKLFDVSFNSGQVSFIIIDQTKEEIHQLLEDIKAEVCLLETAYSKKENQKVE